MRRREFLGALGGAVAWPIAARAQQGERVRRIGVLLNLAANDPEVKTRLAPFFQGLKEAGWTDGRNMQIETRFPAGDFEQLRKHASELVELKPDVIMATATPAVRALQQSSRTIPIVFNAVIDPVGSGLVQSMPRPGGNATGFISFEYALATKWLQLLTEIAPSVNRIAVLRDPNVAAGIGQFAAIQVAGSIGLELSAIDLRDASTLEREVSEFAARGANGGLIVTASQFGSNHAELITGLATRHRLPAVYPYRYFSAVGGLASYGSDLLDEYRRTAVYVDRILKGEKPADLPVQTPTKYKLIINLKTAKALGLALSPAVLARADEVIE
jgi:putative tryptophan/tyrosine transport system substrate-binding protein